MCISSIYLFRNLFCNAGVDRIYVKVLAPKQDNDKNQIVLGWGWFYLSMVLDDYSRYIVSWKLCTNMRAEDVTDTLNLALRASDCDQVHVVHKLRWLSDNGSSYVSSDLAEWLQDKGMKHSRGAPYHPQTQGKVER